MHGDGIHLARQKRRKATLPDRNEGHLGPLLGHQRGGGHEREAAGAGMPDLDHLGVLLGRLQELGQCLPRGVGMDGDGGGVERDAADVVEVVEAIGELPQQRRGENRRREPADVVAVGILLSDIIETDGAAAAELVDHLDGLAEDLFGRLGREPPGNVGRAARLERDRHGDGFRRILGGQGRRGQNRRRRKNAGQYEMREFFHPIFLPSLLRAFPRALCC